MSFPHNSDQGQVSGRLAHSTVNSVKVSPSSPGTTSAQLLHNCSPQCSPNISSVVCCVRPTSACQAFQKEAWAPGTPRVSGRIVLEGGGHNLEQGLMVEVSGSASVVFYRSLPLLCSNVRYCEYTYCQDPSKKEKSGNPVENASQSVETASKPSAIRTMGVNLFYGFS